MFVVIFSKRSAGHGKGLRGSHVARGPRVEDPWPTVFSTVTCCTGLEPRGISYTI
jgi:hypothetical protein